MIQPTHLDLDAARAAAEAVIQNDGGAECYLLEEELLRVFPPKAMIEVFDRLRKAEAAREGWKWVPVEPTPVMISEAWRALIGNADYAKIRSAWDVMLAAAPDSTPTADKAIPLETPAEFALKALVAAGHVSQEKVDKALAIAGKFAAHTRTPTDSADSEGAKG
jgi:hypothetical protein